MNNQPTIEFFCDKKWLLAWHFSRELTGFEVGWEDKNLNGKSWWLYSALTEIQGSLDIISFRFLNLLWIFLQIEAHISCCKEKVKKMCITFAHSSVKNYMANKVLVVTRIKSQKSKTLKENTDRTFNKKTSFIDRCLYFYFSLTCPTFLCDTYEI